MPLAATMTMPMAVFVSMPVMDVPGFPLKRFIAQALF